MDINANTNCNFLTYNNVLFKSYSTGVTAIYYELTGTDCLIDSTSHTFTSDTWLYATGTFADDGVCGFYVGISNSVASSGTFQVIRLAASYLSAAVLAGAVSAAVLLY